RPIAAAIHVQRHNPYMAWPPYPIFADSARFADGTYLWQDGNGDQTIQTGELTGPTDQGNAFNWIDADLNAWCDSGYLLRPMRFEGDRPVYDFGEREAIPFRGANANATSLWLDPDSGTVYTLNPGRAPGLAAWGRQGELLWAYPEIAEWQQALDLPVVTPGKLWGLTMPLGVAGDFTGAATYFNPYHLFTRDGLYVAMVMRDGRTGGLGPDITASETITGQLVRPRGTERYFLLAGDQDGRVTEILGLETVKRLPGGTWELTPAEAARAAAERDRYQAARAAARPLVIARGHQALATATPVEVRVDDEHGFRVRLAWDADSLYAAYEVTGSPGLENGIEDARLVFKGGNALDLQLATDPGAPAGRETPAPGDVRVLVTRRQGQPVAVVYRPRVAGYAGEPEVLRSPTGSESFDRIEVSDRVGLTWEPGDRGFRAVAALPLSLLGWIPVPGAAVALDVGFIYGNPPGTQAAVRRYWANHGRTAAITYDVPSESRLEPARWGRAAVE
ncbi:MAG: hypothetical protein ABIL09_17050, partial [Gemmatimonadota bacterium]